MIFHNLNHSKQLTLFVLAIIISVNGYEEDLFYIRKYPWLEQIFRQELITDACNTLNNNFRVHQNRFLNTSSLEHLLVDHKHRLLYCYVPKVACTNWKRVFMVLTGTSNVSNPLDIPATIAHDEKSTLKVSQLPTEEANAILEEYTAFLIVRHPFERLLSAFRNKFQGNSPSARYFQDRYGRYIIKKYRKKPTSTALKTGSDVTFHEFTMYIIKEGSQANEHWTPVFDLCRPCNVNYTLVGHYERLSEDTSTILEFVGAPPLIFPLTRQGGTKERLKYYYQQLNIKEIEYLYRIYENDFKLFGYDLETILGYDIG